MAVSRRSIRLCPGVPMARPLGAILHRVGGVARLTGWLPAGWPKATRGVRRRRDGPRGEAFPADHGRLSCRFLDAGMPTLSTRCCGRRPKSAKARNRGVGMYGGVTAETDMTDIGATISPANERRNPRQSFRD